MAIRILFGRGGSGKSLYQMHIIVDELLHSDRNVVTNLAIRVPEFNSYLERKYPANNLRLVERLRILSEAETKAGFWKIRGPDVYRVQHDVFADNVVRFMQSVPNPGAKGVAYIIDEAGANGYSAQAWAQGGASGKPFGLECAAYLDQQRKFNDNVYASTNGRLPNRIAKSFRDVAHEFIRLKNGYLKQMGVFRAVPKFKYECYESDPGPNVEVHRKGEFKLGVDGLEDCYDTAAGTGVPTSGSSADKGSRAKGMDIRWAFPIAIGLAALMMLGPKIIAPFLGKAIGGEARKSAGVAEPRQTVGDRMRRGIDDEMETVSGPRAQRGGGGKEELYVKGFAEYPDGQGGVVRQVIMSDGRRYEGAEVQHLKDGTWAVGGDVYEYRDYGTKDDGVFGGGAHQGVAGGVAGEQSFQPGGSALWGESVRNAASSMANTAKASTQKSSDQYVQRKPKSQAILTSVASH